MFQYSQPYVFKLKRLPLDAGRRRRDPIGDLADFSHRFHETAHVLAIFKSWQPFSFLRFELFPGNQISVEIEGMSRVFADVPVKANVRQVQALLETFITE